MYSEVNHATNLAADLPHVICRRLCWILGCSSFVSPLRSLIDLVHAETRKVEVLEFWTRYSRYQV
jgi:hypothetical protein